MEPRREATVIASASEARRLGRYVLLGDIAEGGMGRIYLARAVGAAGFEKLFAVKVMHQGLAQRNSDIGEMFLDEGRINSLVRHPNVCAVHDFGEEAGVSYLVMEFMVGQTLLEVLRRAYTTPGVTEQPLFWARAARIVAEASEGLHAAHRALDERGEPMSVVHRDISPENVFMTYNGAVKVFDFGIAKASGRRHETVAGTFKGKFAYAAPEAFGPQGIDWRSDIWSMGVVLWELLSGRALFHRSSETETFGAIMQEPIPAVRSVRPTCPPELDAIVARLLSRDRDRRYQSAREVARDLNRFAIKSGEHLGHGELGEWMRGLFPEEHRAAIAYGRSVARLDDGAVDAAPRLQSAPVGGLVSQVIERHDEASPDLYRNPTVVHPIDAAAVPYPAYRAEDDEPTRHVRNPPERVGSAAGERGAPSPFAEAITNELRRDGSAASDPGRDSPNSRGVGAPSPFLPAHVDEEAPTLAAPAKSPKLRLVLLVVLGLVALLLGVYLADLAIGSPSATTPPAPPDAPSLPATEAATSLEPPARAADLPRPAPAGPTTTEAASPIPAASPAAAAAAGASDGDRTETGEITTTDPAEDRPRSAAVTGPRNGAGPAPAPTTTRQAGEAGLVGVFAVGGWADIYEDETRLGRTPARLRLAPGRHTLTLRPAEGRALRRVVEVPAGGNVHIRVEL